MLKQQPKSYEYDKENRLTAVVTVDGLRTTLTYDMLGRLSSASNSIREIKITFDNYRNVIQVKYTSENITKFEYNFE